MKNYLLGVSLLAATSTCSSLTTLDNKVANPFMVVSQVTTVLNTKYEIPQTNLKPLAEIRRMLTEQAKTLNIGVINKVLTTLSCAREINTAHNNILTIIDYSLPSSEKRLWIFDLNEEKLLFHTYVSHGLKSGALLSTYFSNKNDSKASSIGVYKTDKAYPGRHGISLRLDGLDRDFNDNASHRAVVMHGSWYVDEPFIKKYGRAGRSWGCPAVPKNLTKSIINTIKEDSLLVIYYPSDSWFIKSKFLNCDHIPLIRNAGFQEPEIKTSLEKEREDILFADINKNNKREENEPVVVMTADDYKRIFNSPAPLDRMLRRQINHVEYIALTNTEFRNMINDNNKLLKNEFNHGLNAVYFVIPVVNANRTEMQILSWGKIKESRLSDESVSNENGGSYIVYLDTKPVVNLRTTSQFIRWLGL